MPRPGSGELSVPRLLVIHRTCSPAMQAMQAMQAMLEAVIAGAAARGFA